MTGTRTPSSAGQPRMTFSARILLARYQSRSQSGSGAVCSSDGWPEGRMPTVVVELVCTTTGTPAFAAACSRLLNRVDVDPLDWVASRPPTW